MATENYKWHGMKRLFAVLALMVPAGGLVQASDAPEPTTNTPAQAQARQLGNCSCPDSAAMCKHVAATLYGIGARLDSAPELLFGLRKVDAKELIARAGEGGTPVQKLPGAGRILDSSKLADDFGIDFGAADPKSSHKPIGKKRKSVGPRKAKSANRAGKRSA